VSNYERLQVDGPAGKIEVFVEEHENPQGIALIAHPHPLFGGTADNKVVTTLARAFREQGCITLRPNFRGVGGSQGGHDNGDGETDDLLALHAWARSRYAALLARSGGPLPVYLAGFSFGAYVVTRLAPRLAATGDPASWLVLVSTAAGFVEGARSYEAAAVPADTLVIHGSEDTTVRLENVLAWAEPQQLPVVVVPGADHFFHRRLQLLRDIIQRAWGDRGQVSGIRNQMAEPPRGLSDT
jgi:alpha/beta superfamily hydrolase